MTNDNVIKDQIEKVTKFRLEFRDFVEKSVEYCTELSGYIRDLKGVVDLVDDKTIHKEDFIEEIKSLSDETKRHEGLSQALFEQIRKILEGFLDVNEDFKPYMNDTKKTNDKLVVELKVAENEKEKEMKLYDKIKPKHWERVLKFGLSGLGAAISPQVVMFSTIMFLFEDCYRSVNATKRLNLVNNANESIKNIQESKDENTELIKDLSILIQALAEISVSLSRFKLFWDNQRRTLSRIHKNLDTAGKGNRINTLKIKGIGNHLDKLKSSISDYNYTFLKTLTYDRMIN
ncbi:26811_t:CDS:2 [Dentiscutata erythropus]|uniref:26811_t:CDS:1 n=1 Tax=Dentiscutata erythropus TaxID=1348616 RepID=A0A9N9EPU9_9GLOM|nr:26811_t:CDS:2 [Dentiscutata erythropus]